MRALCGLLSRESLQEARARRSRPMRARWVVCLLCCGAGLWRCNTGRSTSCRLRAPFSRRGSTPSTRTSSSEGPTLDRYCNETAPSRQNRKSPTATSIFLHTSIHLACSTSFRTVDIVDLVDVSTGLMFLSFGFVLDMALSS